jgi:hypothetical protein
VTDGGRERRYTIGRFGDWATTAARAKARDLRREIDNGGDPLADIEALRGAPSVADLITRFISQHVERKRPSTIRAYRQILRQHIAPYFGEHAKVADVTHDDEQRIVDELKRSKLIKKTRAGRYQITPEGKKALKGETEEDQDAA